MPVKISEKIIELIGLSGEISVNEIAKILDVRVETISRNVKDLDELGKVVTAKVREGRSFITYVSLMPQVSGIKLNHSADKKDQVESEKKQEKIQLDRSKDIKKLLKKQAYTLISLEEYIKYFLETHGVIPSTDTLKFLFLGLSDNDISIVVRHYKEQGYPQWQFRGDYRNVNQLVEEA